MTDRKDALEQPVAPDDVEHVRKLLRRGKSSREGAATGATESGASGTDDKERIERLKDHLGRRMTRLPDARRPDPALVDAIVRGAQVAIRKLEDGAQSFTVREMAAVEAVILTDGTRPSLTIKDGFVDLDAPDVGDWRPALDHFRADIRNVIESVGRVDVGGDEIGTAFVISPDLVITNRHVLEGIASPDGNGWRLSNPANTSVEFAGEKGSARTQRARVVDVRFAPELPIEGKVRLERLDLALLRVEALAGSAIPQPLRLAGDPDALFDGRDLYVVGFPVRPGSYYGAGKPPPRYETNEVLRDVFGFEFGVKKLAPGQVDKVPGELAGDINNWAFSHDASTLGGNSGSCILDLTEDAARVIGLHFAGISRELNFAHSVAALRPQLAPHGASFA